MNPIIEKAKDLEELSLFLSNMNQRKESHIGFCGEIAHDIKRTLTEEFVNEGGDVNFLIARNELGEVISAMGLDVDESVAEVWGPFSQFSSNELQLKIWEQLIKENPDVEDYYFFINNENTQQQQFMDEIMAEKTGEHLIIVMKKKSFNQVTDRRSTAFVPSDFKDFEILHNETFPNTYYNAKTIIERLGNGNTLKVLKNESNKLQGYAYFEVDTEFGEASLEYLSVSKGAQNQGLGTKLLKEVLAEMFTYPQINEIRLTVENTNSRANHMYRKAGFKPQDSLFSYHFKVGG
ncbi:GNAT family N-acetyltransferase [Virgibacillus sp. MSJ-26]|uniref:GNAT family N-acetyltransferase n=1 Tax=Virgibacillus sp. MSJ-26 TaxID=2841522 RepID=UPI001C0F53E1|nr:N-acetyltransferase [Virgibacillus sp. MSJ-26]MBU5466181.1 GNAT family N-acetyltransferase [Virgibacillus sp. MSJ-26]